MMSTRFVSSLLVLATACTTHSVTTRPVSTTARAQPASRRQPVARDARYPAWYKRDTKPLYAWNPADEQRAAIARPILGPQLKQEYGAACKGVPEDVAAGSLLDTFVLFATPVDHGVVFSLPDRIGPPEVVLAELRCHRAWLRLGPSPEGLDSPLLVDGATWTARSTRHGIEVTATSADDGAAAELARRANLVYERASRRSAMR